ncbi:hypothetical protein DR950_21885 [Kitasatospora xanthocidica]|uniref:Uncharacterized protein n=1 Tax=Kitasatospora xanthocidica TaxID=83382 RepID=A0A372ZXB7_9ACTN|nr:MULTISPECIES: hypothetical protein [Kitasatospora]RGD60082.1 hypothetical protein DR950_21885 [Kitasatospora xanthocidica]
MSSTTPAPQRAVTAAGAGESARRVPGEPMRALLAACAAAEAVSTPPGPRPRQDGPRPGHDERPEARTPRAA